MAGSVGTGRVRVRAGRPRSFEEEWSNATTLTKGYIYLT